MKFEDARIFSRVLTYDEIAIRLFLCIKNRNTRPAYFYISVMWLKGFNTGDPRFRIRDWKNAIKLYKLYKTPR